MSPCWYLGVAQMVARYLGVVEAASSNLVTQTKIPGSIEPPIFFLFSCIISRFLINIMGLFFPAFRVEQVHFLIFGHTVCCSYGFLLY